MRIKPPQVSATGFVDNRTASTTTTTTTTTPATAHELREQAGAVYAERDRLRVAFEQRDAQLAEEADDLLTRARLAEPKAGPLPPSAPPLPPGTVAVENLDDPRRAQWEFDREQRRRAAIPQSVPCSMPPPADGVSMNLPCEKQPGER